MSFIKNLKISKKLSLLYIPGLVVLIAVLIVTILYMNHINNITKKTYYDEAYTSTALILNADRDFYQAYLSEKELVLNADLSESEKQELIDAFKEDASQVEDRIKQAIDNIKQNEDLYTKLTSANSQETLESNYSKFSEYFKLWKSSYDTVNLTGNYQGHIEAFSNARDNINSMTEILEEYAKNESLNVSNDIRNVTFILIGLVTLLIILITLFALYIVKYLKISILSTTKDVELLSDNDVSFSAYTVDSKDELGGLSNSVKTLLDSLNNIVTLLSNTSLELSESTDAMKINSNEITQSMNQIADTVGEIASSATQQADEAKRIRKFGISTF